MKKTHRAVLADIKEKCPGCGEVDWKKFVYDEEDLTGKFTSKRCMSCGYIKRHTAKRNADTGMDTG